MLTQHVARAGAARITIQRVGLRGLQRSLTLDDLEPVCGDQYSLGRRVVAVVGSSNTLDQPFDVLRRTNLYHKVHVSPVDTQIERARADNGAQFALGHRGLDLQALLARNRAMVDSDGKGIFIG